MSEGSSVGEICDLTEDIRVQPLMADLLLHKLNNMHIIALACISTGHFTRRGNLQMEIINLFSQLQQMKLGILWQRCNVDQNNL